MPDPIGERLRKCRKQRKWTLRALASVAQVPVSTLSAVENGERPGDGLTLKTAKRLATTLNVSLDWLAYGVDRFSPDISSEERPQ